MTAAKSTNIKPRKKNNILSSTSCRFISQCTTKIKRNYVCTKKMILVSLWKSVASHPKKSYPLFLCACWALKDERFYRFFSSPPLQKPFLPWIVSKSKYSWNTPYFWEYDMSRHLKTYFFQESEWIRILGEINILLVYYSWFNYNTVWR